MEMSTTYNPKSFEDRIYKEWEEKGYFKANPNPDKVPFTVVIPPPNITGQLHMGHALNDSIQDSIVRFKRMQGYETLWLPGTDHASIATEVKIVDALKKEGLSKEEIGREEFLVRAWAWKEKYGGRIVEQLKKLGSSCDWSRLAFTMDENLNKAVKEVFVNLYEKGLIYQGKRIINWCPVCKTALSDAEVDYTEEQSGLWHIKYQVKGEDRYVVVATTRPETMLGDVAVAVNPKDERYADILGKTLILPLANREIPLIADEYVELDFGTGAVKITPAHDPNDFEVGLRHNLPVIKTMNDDGTMNEEAGKYAGLDRFECRKQIVKDLEAIGLLEKTEAYAHNVGHCYRCSTTVEPIISKQWFVKMEPLAKPAIDVVRKKSIKFTPERFTKIYYNWMENIRDWCISRQLWWGHRIPAYYCDDCGEMIVSKTDVTVCPKCNSTKMRQDEDVLDTWFSSALWPFSTLGYPENTEDLKYFYPTDLLVTAYDIIFFWVARMIFSGLEHTGHIPFSDVLIHGLVRDAQGRKMSKSLGNGIDPLEIIDEYGADTLRYALLNGIAPGSDTRFSKDKIEGCRNYINKIWNASRFVLMNCEGKTIKDISEVKLNLADKWIISKLNNTVRKVTVSMNKYEIGVACGELQEFFWNDFCDWYIELSKPYLYGTDEDKKTTVLSVLIYVLKNTLKLLHPYIPFITEEIYQHIPGVDGTIMLAEYPRYNSKLAYRKDAEDCAYVMDIITAIRQIRADSGCAPSKKVDLFVVTEKKNLINKALVYIEKLANLNGVKFIDSKDALDGKTVSVVLDKTELYIPLGELVDLDKEVIRLKGELEKVESEIARANGKLSNNGFLAKAPKALVDQERDKLNMYIDMRKKILANIKELEEM
ncbi:MAG: valine--tRNA ligase [Clostridia bacterium]|nr:valine--tRNA ligase [Clostridia bacterium]